MVPLDLLGKRFGQLTVVERVENASNGQARWKCICDCGETCIARASKLVRGVKFRCKKCRYKYISETKSTHREEPRDLWVRYCCMKNRCTRHDYHAYHRYGGRGITICDEWSKSFIAFRDWALNNGYRKGLTLDRIDNNGNYCPENCRWATQQEQCNNNSRNRIVVVFGEKDTLANWVRKANANYKHVMYLLNKGEDPDDVIGSLIRGDASKDVRV